MRQQMVHYVGRAASFAPPPGDPSRARYGVIMSDAYVPDDDALEQAQEVDAAPLDEDDVQAGGSALVYPERVPPEANDADVLEQAQEIPWDDDHE